MIVPGSGVNKGTHESLDGLERGACTTCCAHMYSPFALGEKQHFKYYSGYMDKRGGRSSVKDVFSDTFRKRLCGHDLVLLSWSGASQNNQHPSPVLHVVQEAQLAPLNQERFEMGCRYIN